MEDHFRYGDNIRPIDRVEFGILSNDTVGNMSAFGKDSAGLEVPDLYDNLEPKKDGLISTLMGPTSSNLACATCGLDSIHCIGHFGHINLAEPVFHSEMMIDYIKKILGCICLKCSKLLIHKNEEDIIEMMRNKPNKSRFSIVSELTKGVTNCAKANYDCGTPVTKIRKEERNGTISLISELEIQTEEGGEKVKNKIRQELTPEICYDILKNISDSDCMIMGLDPKKTRPENMIITKLPVSPVSVRPSAKVDFMDSSSKEDDLTHKLADIIRANNRLRKYKESSNETTAKYASDYHHVLQFHVFTNINNESSLIPKSEQKSKAIKTFNSRLKGKEGRVRSNLMGKRVNFSARTVITGEPNIDLDQLRVPVKIAMILTEPEVVTPQNIEELKILVENGRYVYPGANFVFRFNDGEGRKGMSHADLRYVKVDLKIGDIVERHLANNDYVLLNRQPTLHKLSMMGFRVVVFNDTSINTFGLNPVNTKPFNADFDGDEMNIFLPQSIQARIELQEIADVQKQVITPASSVPILGVIQDGLVGGYNLTQPNMKIDWKTAMNIISYTTLDDFSSLKKGSDISGTDLFSLIIPSKINSTGNLEIKNGKIVKGHLGAQSLGSTKPQNLPHLIWDEYGFEETRKFFDNTQRLINNFNLWNGFSVGIGDIDVSKELENDINKIIESKKLEINHLITEMENNPDLVPLDVFEETILSELNAVRPNFSKTITENLKPDNGFGRMVWAGSKGNPDNIGQMGACLGQQNLEGKRIPSKYNGRATQYFHQHDDSATGRGFIEQPFYTGIHPTRFIFHNMSSREGLIDTAIKSVTGDTPIVILENNKPKRVMIGNWIDKQLEEQSGKVEHYTEREMELLKITNKVYIPTCDSNGNVSWGEISAITRHDPGKELYEIKTLGGRHVIVTESKSLLIWDKDTEQFVMMSTPDVKIGDYVPVTNHLSDTPQINDDEEYFDDLFDELFGCQHACEACIPFRKEHFEVSDFTKMLTAPVEYTKKFIEYYLCKELDEIKQDNYKIHFDNNELAISFSMLLNKVNIFSKINGNNLVIKKNNIILNDVVLDAITEINKIDVAKYPKVYDLTVPSTLNFGLANGLHVVDTADSGYVQRKLIKLLEDISVKYDSTVRDSNNNIIQYIYGDNGLDNTRQSKHNLMFLEMGNSEISDKIKFTEQELKNFRNFKSSDNNKYYEEVIRLRNKIRNSRLLTSDNNIAFENGFMLPVNLRTLIGNIKNSNIKDEGNLDPDYIINKLEEILEYDNTKVTSMSQKESDEKDSLKYKDELTSKTVFRFSLYEHLSPKICIFNYGIKKSKFDLICDKIIERFNKSVVEPGEMVGIIAGQSIGEPTTQMTLNSIDWNEEIILLEDDKIIIKEIGAYIDEKVDLLPDKITRYDSEGVNEMGDTVYIDISELNVKAISLSEDGQARWNKVSALTKHLPVNLDGTNDLVKITTSLGRTVTATKAKSFLTRVDNKIVPIRGDEIKVGTRVPVIMNYPEPENVVKYLDMSEYFSKSEYIYGSEIMKAKKFRDEQKAKGSQRWFKGYHKVLFTTPYSRQDSLQDVLDGKRNLTHETYKEGCVYPRTIRYATSEIPDMIELDRDFGFFIGAYLAEGLITKTYVAIANNDEKYRKKITDLCDKWKVGYHIQKQENKIKEGWTSTDVRIHSVIIARLLKALCNTGSEHKVVPSFAFNAPLDFVKGLMDGYFSGDGCVSGDCKIITCSSISEKMIDGLVLLLTRLGIICTKRKPKKIEKNNRGSQNIKQHWIIYIGSENVCKFAKEVSMCVDYKQKRLDKSLEIDFKYKNSRNDIIPGNNLEFIKEDIHRDKIKDLLESNMLIEEEYNILTQAYNSHVVFDEIVKIEYIKPSKEYVYDLTVDNDKTFLNGLGIYIFDTFHGAGTKSATSLGVPRIKELLSFSKNIKTPSMTIYLTEENKANAEIANKIASHLKQTTIMDIRNKIGIYYDPNPLDKDGFMAKDNAYNVFYSYSSSKNACQTDIQSLPWLMRIELNREQLMEKDLTLLDIKSKYCNNWEKRYDDIKNLKKDEKILLEKITQTAIISNSDNDKEPVIHIRFDMEQFDFAILTSFIDVFVDNFKLKGLTNISKIYGVVEEDVISFDNENEELEKEKQQVIYTGGVNMIDIRYINGIDLNKSICNDMATIYNIYGIDAFVIACAKEIKSVFAASGGNVNYSHVMLLADLMGSTGTPISIDRHGMGKLDIDPLARASFEKTVEQVLQAAVFGEVDKMNNVSSRIMAGLAIRGGTGLCEVLLDSELLEKSEYTEEVEHTFVKSFNEVSKSNLISDVMNKEVGGFFMPDF